MFKGQFFLWLKDWKLILKCCIYHIIWVRDINFEVPTLKSVLVVNKFLDLFLDDLFGIYPDRKIDFGIDLHSDTKPIYIPLYFMDLAELKELKNQLNDLLD